MDEKLFVLLVFLVLIGFWAVVRRRVSGGSILRRLSMRGLVERTPDGIVRFLCPAPAADSLRVLSSIAAAQGGLAAEEAANIRALATAMDITDDGMASHVPEETFMRGLISVARAVRNLPEDENATVALYDSVNQNKDEAFEVWCAKLGLFVEIYM